jgi:DNA-binding CsgD family transcriptional regulator
VEAILLQEQIPDRRTHEYSELLGIALSAIAFTHGELIEIGSMLHGLTVEQSSRERHVILETTRHIRRRIRLKLGATNTTETMDDLCRLASPLVPPLDGDVLPLMKRLTPAEENEKHLAAVGLTTKESALMRDVTYNTVHTQRTSVREKRAAHTMGEAILNDYRLQTHARTHPAYVCPTSAVDTGLRQADHTYRVSNANQSGSERY